MAGQGVGAKREIGNSRNEIPQPIPVVNGHRPSLAASFEPSPDGRVSCGAYTGGMFTDFQTLHTDPRFRRFTFGVADMPKWARLILLIVMIPGIMLVVLSLFAVVVSILALLLFTVPVFKLLKAVTGDGRQDERPRSVPSTGTKRVQATVRDA